MEILQYPDHSDLTRVFFPRLLSVLDLLSHPQREIVIGLSGGSSLDIYYAYICAHFAEIPERIRILIRFVLLDERVVSVDHVDSNEGQLRAKFLDKLIEEGNIRESQIISIDMSRTNISESYSQIVPRIDIALFGVGPDGHIASLFPHHPLLDSLETGYLEIIDAPKPPAHRVTVSPEMIRGISHVFVVFMRGKEEVYARFFDESISIRDCPVRLLYQSTSLVVMSDIDRELGQL